MAENQAQNEPNDMNEDVWEMPYKRAYHLYIRELMSHVHGCDYPGNDIRFSKEELLSINPRNVTEYLSIKAYGKPNPAPGDALKGRSKSLDYYKKAISYFLPNSYPWVEIPGSAGHGNPTRSKAVNDLIAKVRLAETRGIGKKTSATRPLELAEYRSLLSLCRESTGDQSIKLKNPLMALYQWHMITRIDDVANFRMADPKAHFQWPFALRQKVRWSKNVRDERACPDQLLLASMDSTFCLFIALAMYLEWYLSSQPDSVMMFTNRRPPTNCSDDDHSRFIGTVTRTYRNQLAKHVYSKQQFKSVYDGDDDRPIGTHSCRKAASTYAKRCGQSEDNVDHRGRWKPSGKRSNRVVTGVYIDPKQEAIDAEVASVLCIGGPIKYKLKTGLAAHITKEWIQEHIVPNIAFKYPNRHQSNLVYNLGLALLCVCMDLENFDLPIDAAKVASVQSAYEALDIENKPEQPVAKVPIVCYRVADQLHVKEVVQTAMNDDGTPATEQGGAAALPTGAQPTDAFQQAVLIQIRDNTQEIQNLRAAMDAQINSLRQWEEGQFQRINNNIRRFGGTIQGGLARQNPRAQEERRAAAAEARGAAPPAAAAGHGRVNMPTLAPNLKTLHELWREWQFGIGGRKPAKNWTPQESGNPRDRIKQTFYRRKCLWNILQRLINQGHNIDSAVAQMKATYGQRTSVTDMQKAIVRDRRVYRNEGGLHPNFR